MLKKVLSMFFPAVLAVLVYLYVMGAFLVLAVMGLANLFAVGVALYAAYRAFVWWRGSVSVK
jgi:hypothetical protein